MVEGAVKNARHVPFTKTADSLGKKIVANIVMLGYLTPVIDMIPKKKMVDTIKDNIPRGTEEINLQAFEKGYNLGKKGRR